MGGVLGRVVTRSDSTLGEKPDFPKLGTPKLVIVKKKKIIKFTKVPEKSN